MARKPISDSVKKKLHLLSGNQCAFPGCTERLFDKEGNTLLAKMCHIVAVNPTGPRYDPEYAEEEINSYDNIVLLCSNHHDVIDQNEEKYTSDVLRNMKAEHESKYYNNAFIFDELVGSKDSGVVDKNRLAEYVKLVNTMVPGEPILPSKKSYPKPETYIQRYLSSIRDESLFDQHSKTLTEILKEENRITVLGVGGFGKSIELDHAAYVYSQSESDYYPIKVRLNTVTNQSLDEILVLEYPEFNSIPQENMIIMLDALDEVHSDFLDVAARNISILSQKYQKAKIIVTCRNNFYTAETEGRRAKLDGFNTFIIQPLTEYSIYQYLRSHIDANTDHFISTLRRKKFFDLLFSPFYLVNLVKYYNSNGNIPDSKKTVFEYLINQRIGEDLDKNRNTGLRIEDYILKVKNEIQRLAISAECLGRNYLDWEKEVLELVPDTNLITILKRTFLFNKSNDGSHWEFEHNNFQEYLAAKFLSKLEFENIKQFVSFSPKFEKIKPSWLNTLSFLFSLLEEQDKLEKLIQWIYFIEPDALIRLEKDKISLSLRERIFREIYESYESKGIIIRNEKFESEDLAHFVSDSRDILEYLIKKVDQSDDKMIISEAVRIFEYFDCVKEYRAEICQILTMKICKPELEYYVKYSCLFTLAVLEVFTIDGFEKILQHNKLTSSKYIRAGIYRFLASTDEVEKYLNILLEGIKLLELPIARFGLISEEQETSLADEEINLLEAFNSIKSPKNIINILNWATSYENESLYYDTFFEVLKDTLKKASILFNNGEKKLFDCVIQLLSSFFVKNQEKLKEELKSFFVETNTVFNAFIFFYEKVKETETPYFEYESAMALICNKECLDYLVKDIKSGDLSDHKTTNLRDIFRTESSKDIYDLFYEELKEIDVQKYAYNQIDYLEISRKRRERDIYLLFSKTEFLDEVIEIFKKGKEGKSILTNDELNDLRRKHLRDEEVTSQIILETLKNRAKEKNFVELKEIKGLVANEISWTWFVLQKLIFYDVNNSDFNYGKTDKKFIDKWISNSLSHADFKTAITLRDGNSYHYRYLELYVAYFAQRLDIELSVDIYLKFLYIDCYLIPHRNSKNPTKAKSNDKFIDFIIQKIGLEATKNWVVEHLEEDDLIPIVKKNHFKFCNEYKVGQISPILLDEILSNNFTEHEKREFIEYYINLDGNIEKLEDVIDDLEIELRFHTIEKLIDNGNFSVKEYCIDQLNSIEDEDNILRYIKLISKISESEALVYLKSWILRNKILPDHWSEFKTLDSTNLSDIIEIFEDSLLKNYGDSPWNNRDYYLNLMLEISSTNESDFIKLKGKLESWIQEYRGTKYLHYQIQKLEQLYYSKKSQSISFEQVKRLINSDGLVEKERSCIESFWLSNKTTIEIVLAVLTVAGLLFTIFSLF